jgi:hypothetical protein
MNEPPVLEDTYQVFVERYYSFSAGPFNGRSQNRSLDQVKEKDPRARTTDYNSFIRGDLLKEIEQSGFHPFAL